MSNNPGSSGIKTAKTKPTGYWIFFCNPKRWAIDDFLQSGEVFDTFSVTEWQKGWFERGQLGVIRVGWDRRTLKQLSGKKRLQSGIYAIVEILGKPELSASDKTGYWYDNSEGEKARYRVPIKYLKSLLKRPVCLERLKASNIHSDKHLMNGFQASTMPLNSETFTYIINVVGKISSTSFEFNSFDITNYSRIAELERAYSNAVPEVRQRISKYIERGVIAQKFKLKTYFKCQICDSLKLNPYSFKKRNGEYYVETHHVIPVSELKSGVLSANNLITVCANHHRQLHYGDAELLKNNEDVLVFVIDGERVEVKKPIGKE